MRPSIHRICAPQRWGQASAAAQRDLSKATLIARMDFTFCPMTVKDHTARIAQSYESFRRDEWADLFALGSEFEFGDLEEVADCVVPAVAGGDLEAVENESGAFGVEQVGSESAEDIAEDELDGGAVFEYGHGDGCSLGRGSDGFVRDGCGGRDGRVSTAGLQGGGLIWATHYKRAPLSSKLRLLC